MAVENSRLCRRCDGTRWPMGFVRCPACDTPTKLMVGLPPTKTKFHAYEAKFEREYVAREERRIAEGHLAPEALGKREARQIIELERHLDGEEQVA